MRPRGYVGEGGKGAVAPTPRISFAIQPPPSSRIRKKGGKRRGMRKKWSKFDLKYYILIWKKEIIYIRVHQFFVKKFYIYKILPMYKSGMAKKIHG